MLTEDANGELVLPFFLSEAVLTKKPCGIVLELYKEKESEMGAALRIFTWHIHGSYLFYLSQGPFEIYIPVNSEGKDRNIGRGTTFPFGENVIEVPAAEVKNMAFDCILFQADENYLIDQFKLLSPEQRQLPRIYLEHDPPWEHPTDTPHIVNDPEVLIVHVTHFNRLMWNNKGLSSIVIEHGVTESETNYSGNLEKGIVVINNLPSRGRMLGYDIFNEVRKKLPLDLIGMGTGEPGSGEVLHPEIRRYISSYKFFFNPIRYTSFGLAVCEAMMTGLPVVGLATTEMPMVFENGVNGIIHTDIDYLISRMKTLLEQPRQALEIGAEGQRTARSRFNIHRFVNDWENAFRTVIKNRNHAKTNSFYQ